MSQIRHQRHYQAMYIPKSQRQKEKSFLGVAFEVEKPVHNLVKSFWNVLSSPVDPVSRKN